MIRSILYTVRARRRTATGAPHICLMLLLVIVGCAGVLASGGSSVAGSSRDGESEPGYEDPAGNEPVDNDPTRRWDRYRDEQLLISNNTSGLPANASSGDPAISQDNRTAVAVAYESSATDIVGQKTGGHNNVYLVHRRRPFGHNAEESWKIAETVMASRGSGTPNGDSWNPTFDGDDTHAASCLAFLSKASNLVGGDRNHRADVFVRSLRGNGLRRIATPGSANSVDVDGGCDHIIYATGCGVYVDGPGGEIQRIARGRASDATIDTYARAASFERGGSVFMWREGKGVKKIGRGTSPVISPNGKMVIFEDDGNVRRYRLLTGKTGTVGPGKQAAMTLTAVFIFWINGDLVDATGLSKPAASCTLGPRSPATSAHGNYVLYTCPPGPNLSPHAQVYLSYIGGYSHGR